MKHKILLTSLLALTIVCPSFAAVDIAKNPQTDPACTNSVLKTYTGPTDLEADYTANTINLNFYSDENTVYSTGTCTYDGGIELPEEDPTRTGYTFDGWQVRRAAAAPTLNLSSIIGTDAGESRAYVNGSDKFTEDSASYGQSFYGITSGDTNAFAVNYGNNGIIHGHGACSTTPGTANWSEPYSFSTESSITDQTGTEGARYCWCHVDGYTPKDGTLQSVSSSWVFANADGGASNCANYCAHSCSFNLRSANSNSLAFRAAVLGSVQ